MSGIDNLGEYLEKAKYIKRTGMPGHYKYEYETPAGEKREVPSRGAVGPTPEPTPAEHGPSIGKPFAEVSIPGTKMRVAMGSDPERKDISRYKHYALDVKNAKGDTIARLAAVTERGEPIDTGSGILTQRSGKPIPMKAFPAIEKLFREQMGGSKQPKKFAEGSRVTYQGSVGTVKRTQGDLTMVEFDGSGTAAEGILTERLQPIAEKSMDGIEGMGEYLAKGHVAMGHPYTQVGAMDPEQEARVAVQTAPTIAAFQSVDMVKNDGHDDGKPGESLGETDTAELTATHKDLMARLKQKPGDPAMTARFKAICGELKRRGKHSEHAMAKGLPSEEAGVSPEKAKQILRDGEVHGRPLTEGQRGMFGAIAGKAKKSMEGIDALGDYLEKGHGATVAETTTSGDYRIHAGAPSGAISGDDPAGKGALPHGATDYHGVGEEDGDYEGLQEHTTGSGPNPMGPGNAEKPGYLGDPTGALMEGHASGRYRKSLPDGTLMTPGRILEMTAHERAQLLGELNKSDDVVVGVGNDPHVPPLEPEPVAKSWMHGDLVRMTDWSDLAVEKMQKSGEFYHGDAPRVGQSGLLRKSKLCARGHQMPAMLTSCPGCGVGSQFNPSIPAPGFRMQKSGAGLRQAYEPDLVLPQGIALPTDGE